MKPIQVRKFSPDAVPVRKDAGLFESFSLVPEVPDARELNKKNLKIYPHRYDYPAKVSLSRPLYFEIGCGVGKHPIALAKAEPGADIIACEHTTSRSNTLRAHVRSALVAGVSLDNFYFCHGNAISVLTHEVPSKSLDRIYLLYPNPYPKPKDLNKRWHAMPFFSVLLDRLKPGGVLILSTNIENYILEARQYIEHYWSQFVKIEVVEFMALKSHNIQKFKYDVEAPRTHFEKKYLERAQTCFHYCVRVHESS